MESSENRKPEKKIAEKGGGKMSVAEAQQAMLIFFVPEANAKENVCEENICFRCVEQCMNSISRRLQNCMHSATPFCPSFFYCKTAASISSPTPAKLKSLMDLAYLTYSCLHLLYYPILLLLLLLFLRVLIWIQFFSYSPSPVPSVLLVPLLFAAGTFIAVAMSNKWKA